MEFAVPNEDVLSMKYQVLPRMALRGCLQLLERKRETQIAKMLQQRTVNLKRTLIWDKALEYVNAIVLPIKEFGSYKDRAEKSPIVMRKIGFYLDCLYYQHT